MDSFGTPNAARWQRAREIFEAALDLPSDARSDFLSQACTGDEALRQQVERLLAADASAGSFTDTEWLNSTIESPTVTVPHIDSSIPDPPSSISKIVEALHTITILTGLTADEYTWLATHSTERILQEGTLIFREGEPCCHMSLILRGEVHVCRRKAGPLAVFISRTGDMTGLLPFSRMKEYGGDGTAVTLTWGLEIHKDLFPEMLAAIPSMGQRCISAMLDRVREVTRIEQQVQKSDAFDKFVQCPVTQYLAAGDSVSGRFQIVRPLGGGGMGQVYLAHDSELGVQVALKIIRPEISDSPEVLARFRREARITHRITHPNVCRTFDLGHEIRQIGPDPANSVEVIFLTMEYLGGETLQQLLKRKGKLEPSEAILIASQMAEGLTAAHQAGIVHRDIKPTNVMIVPSGSRSATIDRVVLTDFGLARFETVVEGVDTSSISYPGRVMGTLAYMAPEQLQEGNITPATDIYAFGLVLYEIVTGEKAFPDSQSLIAAFRRTTQPLPSPRALVPELPSEWETTVLGCLQIDPSRRFQSASDVVAILKGIPGRCCERPRA